MATASDVVSLLTAHGVTVATCESLTAGLAAATLADVPGASAVLLGGLITYATETKHRLAGVDKRLLEIAGPVAAVTAEAMAVGARQQVGADFALSLTGVAGPGPQDGHAPGEVFIAVAGPISVCSRRVLIDGDRRTVRARAVTAAFVMLAEQVREQTVGLQR